jgi:histone H3/H4
VDEKCLELGNVSASADFISSLTSYVWMQLQTMTEDAEQFAAHRSSKVVETADVLLCARKNEDLDALLRAHVDEQRTAADADKSRRR